MIFFYFKHYFIFFNVNEHLAVPFVCKEWVPGEPSLFFLFTQDFLSGHSYSHTSLILLIALNLPCYLHFALYLFIWLMKPKCIPHPSHYYDCFRESNIVFIMWTPLTYMGWDFWKIIEGVMLVSTIFYQIFISHQMIALSKLWKMFFISFKKLFSFSRYSDFCISIFPSFSPCQPLL